MDNKESNKLVCSKCKKLKNVSEFSRNNSTTRGFCYMCKGCLKEYYSTPQMKKKRNDRTNENYRKLNKDKLDKKKQAIKKWQKTKSPEYFYWRNVKCKYGITEEEFYKTLRKQNNKCAICDVNLENLDYKPHIDHCHKTNKFRGILCQRCNHGLGKFKDNINNLKKAIDYLISFNNKQT